MFHSNSLIFLALFCLFGCCNLASADDVKRPNIVFILADDLAWSDLGCYGHRWHRTPNIDKLAERGTRFTNAYASAPICSASRASILTGKTTARLGFEFVTKEKPGRQNIDFETLLEAPPLTLNLPLAENTIAERLTHLGYETAFFGKWHLNQHHNRYLGWSPTHGPQNQGFQTAVEDFGAHPYAWNRQRPKTIEEEGTFTNDSMVQHVCDFIRQEHDRPYFVMASSFYVHTPVRTNLAWLVDHYEGTIPADVANRSNRVKYAAFLETLDHHVGKILAAVDESKQSKNTLVLFFSDNGGHPEYTGNAPLRGSKWNLYEGGIRVPMIAYWHGNVPVNRENATPVIGYDLLPTLVAAAGGKAADVDGQPIDLTSHESSANTERPLLWHFPYYHPERGYGKALPMIGVDDFAVSKTRPQSAIRRGNDKLLWFAEEDRVELYDLQNDLSEQHDRSSSEPEKAAALKTVLQQMLSEQNARLAQPR